MSTLFIVATPIGHLDDISRRALDTLREVDYIGVEDTRISKRLLDYYDIENELFTFHQHNEHRKVNHLINLLDANHTVALISDAGMPGISDPGFLAVREAHKQGHQVRVIPGPDAATTAIVASGLPCDRYIYEGFLPPKKGRQKQIKQYANEQRSIVLFESPHRLLKLMDELSQHLSSQRMIAVGRELTKKFEEILRGPLAEVYENLERREEIKGEHVIILAGCDYQE